MELATMDQAKDIEDGSGETTLALEMLGVLVMVVLTFVIGGNSMDRDVINFLREQLAKKYRYSRVKGTTVTVHHLIIVAIIIFLAKRIASVLANWLRDQIAKHIKPSVKGVLVMVRQVILFVIILVVIQLIAAMRTSHMKAMTQYSTDLVPT